MKKILYHIVAIIALVVIGNGSVHAQTFINNGSFETWTNVSGTPPSGTVSSWGGSAPTQVPGLVSGYSALLGNGVNFYQQCWPSYPSTFLLNQVIALDRISAAWAQVYTLTLQSLGTGGDFATRFDWIQLRIAGSGSTLSLQANNAGTWVTIAANAFSTSVYSSSTNTFQTLNAYNLNVLYDSASNTYSVTYGLLGNTQTTLSGLNYYKAPNNGQSLALLNYWGDGGGDNYSFALDNVTVTVPEPRSLALLAGGLLLLLRRPRPRVRV